jgi:WD40 repeat protein
MVISPDGKTLAAGAHDTILLWELASGKERARFQGHQEWVWSLAFSPTGRLLASGSLDHTALVWDVTGICQDGKLLNEAEAAAIDG